MLILPLQDFPDYELIDCGGGEKLERFGKYTLRRPEPQAVWQKVLSEDQWQTRAQATFVRKTGTSASGEDSGNWTLNKEMPQQWQMGFAYRGMNLKFRLGLTSFKHVGLFPEQADNWRYLYDHLSTFSSPTALNLFAYTGAASLACKAAGADITHLDSIKQTVSWARENMELSRLDGIRWMVEDALKFVQRAVRRDARYNALILDPPAYGRGPDGEKWVLDKNIDEFLACCAKILAPRNAVFVMNLYSLGLSALAIENLIRQHFKDVKSYEFGELYIPSTTEMKLPLGTFIRFTR